MVLVMVILMVMSGSGTGNGIGKDSGNGNGNGNGNDNGNGHWQWSWYTSIYLYQTRKVNKMENYNSIKCLDHHEKLFRFSYVNFSIFQFQTKKTSVLRYAFGFPTQSSL